MLATSTGRTLYLYTPDGKNTEQLHRLMRHVLAAADDEGQAGRRHGRQAVAPRDGEARHGKLQVTYNGHPLYSYASDSKAGQTNGEGSDGTWYVVSAARREEVIGRRLH